MACYGEIIEMVEMNTVSLQPWKPDPKGSFPETGLKLRAVMDDKRQGDFFRTLDSSASQWGLGGEFSSGDLFTETAE